MKFHKLKISLLLLAIGVTSCSGRKINQENEIVTPSGLRYSILKNGTGETAHVGQEVLMHERMGYLDGTWLYSTKEMGSPVSLRIGGNQVIDGVDEGIRGMRTGELRKLIVPPSLSKRNDYPPFLSPDSTLVYEIELVEIIKTTAAPAAVIYHSTDAGETWIPYANGIPEDATVSAFFVKGDIILATTDSHGIYSIRQGETQWHRIDRNLPENVDINAITSTGNVYVIGTFEHGILISKNNGSNWSYPSIPVKNTPVRCLHQSKDFLLAGTDNGIYKSMDKGDTWKQVYDGVQVNGFTEMNNKIYAAMMNGAMMTDDNGINWKYIYKPHTLHDISNDGESIYAMTLGGGLLKSRDDGFWENVNNGLGTLNLYTFELKRYNNKIFAAQWYGIYHSGNGGKSWNIIKNGLPDSTAFTTLETIPGGLIAGIGGRKK